MDLAKLIAQRDKFVADAAAALDRRGLAPDAIKRPVDLQAEQADRVRQRIDGLERRKKELVASIDTELAELKRDLNAREQKMKAERSGQGNSAPSAGGASSPKKRKIAAEPAAGKAALTARAPAKKPRPAPKKGK